MTNDPQRLQRLQAGLEAAQLDAVLAWRPEEVVLCTGACPQWGMTVALIPRQADPIQYPVETEPIIGANIKTQKFKLDAAGGFENLKHHLQDDLQKLAIKQVGIAPDGGRHAPAGNSAEGIPLSLPLIQDLLSSVHLQETDFFAQQMRCKTDYETEKIQLANHIAAYGLRAFYAHLQAGKSEVEIAAAVESAIHVQSGQQGIGLARAWAYVQGGKNAALAGTYSRSSGYILQEGDMVMLELGTWVDGYWSDLTRTGIIGTPSPEQAELMEVASQAQEAALQSLKAGVTGAEVDKAARQVMIAGGFGEAFHHATGHQVGFRYHDYGMMLAKGITTPLEAGMIVTIEPGAYVEGVGGCRFEDNVLVTADGYRMLSDQGIRS